MGKTPSDDDTKLSDEETAQRFKKIVRAALRAPAKRMKDLPRQRPYKPRKRKGEKSLQASRKE